VAALDSRCVCRRRVVGVAVAIPQIFGQTGDKCLLESSATIRLCKRLTLRPFSASSVTFAVA
jgi:hypothetical protein